MYTCVSPVSVYVDYMDRNIDVPCGNCYPCQMRRRAEWDLRLMLEYYRSSVAAFVTYTYDDDYLCVAHSYREFQLLHKRMRNDGLRFRFYHVSEFGELRGRPHNHELLFFDNPDFDILELYGYGQYGLMDVGEVNRASIHYVTKWHVHPKYRRGESVEKHGFTRMSKAIGSLLLDNGLSADNIGKVIQLDGDVFPTPRYYRKKTGVDSSDFVWRSRYEKFNKKTGHGYLDYVRHGDDLKSKSLEKQRLMYLRKLE